MKDFFSRLGHNLANPRIGLVLSFVFLDALSIIALVLNVMYLGEEALTIVSCSFLGMASAYLLFLAALALVRLYRSRLVPKLESTKLGSYFPEGTAYRAIFFAVLSSLANLAFAGMNLFLAVAYGSVWYGSQAAYYSLLLVLRLSTFVASYLAGKKFYDDPEAFLRAKEKIRLVESSLLLPFDILMGGAVTAMVIVGPPEVKGKAYAIASAAFAFYKLVAAIVRLAYKRKRSDPVVKTIRLIALSDALMSMVSLTVLMIATFGGDSDLPAITSSVGFLAVALAAFLSLQSIFSSGRHLLSLSRGSA